MHLMFDCDGAACDAAFLAAAALTYHAVSGGSEHFDPFKGASGVEDLATMWSGLYATVQPFMSQTAMGGLDVVLTDTMVGHGLPGFGHSVLTDLAEWRQQLLKKGLSPENCRRVDAVADVIARAWLDALPVACLLYTSPSPRD